MHTTVLIPPTALYMFSLHINFKHLGDTNTHIFAITLSFKLWHLIVTHKTLSLKNR